MPFGCIPVTHICGASVTRISKVLATISIVFWSMVSILVWFSYWYLATIIVEHMVFAMWIVAWILVFVADAKKKPNYMMIIIILQGLSCLLCLAPADYCDVEYLWEIVTIYLIRLFIIFCNGFFLYVHWAAMKLIATQAQTLATNAKAPV